MSDTIERLVAIGAPIVAESATHRSWSDIDERGREQWRARFRDALTRALTAAGWAVVPREPTEAMLDAGNAAWWRKTRDIMAPSPTEHPDDGDGPLGYAYRAMLAAAPPAQEDAP